MTSYGLDGGFADRLVFPEPIFDGSKVGVPKRWRPSIHMPRWASRLTLEIAGVRAERVQEIGEADAKAEGCDGDCPIGYIPAYEKAPFAYHYAQLWDSINAARGFPWSSNPFVWVVTFKIIPQLTT